MKKISGLRIIGVSDGSFGNNRDLSSQIGYIIFITDDSKNLVPRMFRSYKSKRITRSVMADEVIEFIDLCDFSISMAETIRDMTGKAIPVQLFTDSKFLFDVICNGSRTLEKRMMIDVFSARQAFKGHMVSDIGIFVDNNFH